jgi:uncharacterized SAM-binding protein YcdF (DUF218 family)
MGLKPRLLLVALAVIAALLTWAAITRLLAPTGNAALTRFNAIIVLGSPADGDGNPKPTQLSRVTEAVREYQRGVAPRLILTGGPAHNQFVEARVMARSAEADGIPASAIYMEPEALDTIHNACYAARIMKAHGWRTAEVVTSAAHVPRAGIIFNALADNSQPLQWSMHTAPPLAAHSAAYDMGAATVEVLKTARYLTWARWVEHCEP